MGRKKDISNEQRSSVILLYEEGYCQNIIAGRLSLSCATVNRIVNGSQPNERRGRLRKTTRRDDSLLKRLVNTDPFITSSKIKAQLPSFSDISTRTIRRRLQEDLQLPARITSKKPFIPKTAIQRRLAFCRKYQDWTIDNWKSVLFSDESTFRQFNNIGRFVRRPPGSNPNNPRFVSSTVKYSPQIMVWGCFALSGHGGLHFLSKDQTMTAITYQTVLEENLSICMSNLACDVFQHDSAPCHKAKVVTQWFQENSISVLDWPSYSPDLNPIENLWGIVKKKLSALIITSLPHLQQEITRIWCLEVTPELCQRLISSMPQRIKEVIKNKGNATRY